ncbi:hydrocephalus-inducing protein homolog [Scleropages formosus]|uniref:hydrocephalus-inducing protein homolog n=1 Tax=Scleropages formosus TaxID=113540 RepID=UPI0010FA98B0|nr:hydrocephalus-inducing protein homolog [Scleropages formosus]
MILSREKMTPSAFAQEMFLTTEQRLANTHSVHPPRILELLDISDTTYQKISSVDNDQAVFQPFPSEIVFQNYTPSETYQVPLVLRNNDKIPRLVKVVEEESLYFKVVNPVDVRSKVAPGMALTFTVLFKPQENKDYIHRIIFVTERERFEVPIRAIGPRAILDFPDHLHFSACPVKSPSERILLVRNIGNAEAKFQLCTKSPFSVDPSLGTLKVGQSMQVTVEFLPKTTGDFTQDLVLQHHTGEDIYISLYGAAVDVNVQLDKNSIIMEKTYISMASQRSVIITNRSDIIVHYQWKGSSCEEEEEQLKLRSCLELQQQEEVMMDQFLAECNADPTLCGHLSVLSRAFYGQQRQLQEEHLAFFDDCIIISPSEGDIWPNTTAMVNIVFKPQEAKLYQQTVYCDVMGRESRLPLRIKGEGIGPQLQFNFDLLDMGNIFINSKHSYEVLLSNKGYIEAPFCLVPPSSTIGLCFSFAPSEGVLPPGACHAMVVSFSSPSLGTFTEEILFSVTGNPQPLVLTFRGCVIGPTFQFNVPELSFGDVSFGFPHTLTCSLNNTSLVPMTFDLRILGDSSGPPSLAAEDQVLDLNRTDWGPKSSRRIRPREFTLSPSSGSLRAQGVIDIQVTLCSNNIQVYNFALVVDVQGVGQEVLALPIHARCVVPKVRLDTPLLELQRCFLSYPYEKSVRLINDSDLPACYGLLSQECEEHPSVVYFSSRPRGILQPHEEVQIPLVLQAKTLGRLQATARVAVFGSEEPPLDVILSCTGEGPVVHVPVTTVDFGNIPVLTDVCQTVQLLNQSPIPAVFLAQMVRSRSQFHVEPCEGEVPPNGELQLRLVAHLDDTTHFQDKLHLAIRHSRTHSIPVSARGKGTTIVSDRPFAPYLDLGTHFR